MRFGGDLRSIEAMARRMRASVIAIDGWHGSGKTTVANAIGDKLCLPVVHLDTFVKRGRGAFIAALKVDELKRAVGPGPVIIEGVCILAALKTATITPDVLIYVDGPLPDIATSLGRGPVYDEVRDYHDRWNPKKLADFVTSRERLWQASHQGRTAMQYRVEVDVAYIKAKTALAITLAIGGMLALCVGVVVLLYGVNGQDEMLFRIPGLELSAKGLGGVIMSTSAVWAYCSYKSRPKYSRVEQTVERTSASGDTERSSYLSSTQFVVHPNSES